MRDIFISYAHEDRRHAESLAKPLSARGWTLWWDSGHSRWAEHPVCDRARPTRARCVTVLWSSSSVESAWIIDEAAEASGKLVTRNDRGGRAADLTGWNGDPSAPSFVRLLEDIVKPLGPRKSLCQNRQRSTGNCHSRRRCHSADLDTTVNSFILHLIMGHNGSAGDIPSGPQGQQAKPSRRKQCGTKQEARPGISGVE